MSSRLTRRQFAALTLATTCLSLPSTAWAKPAGYAAPHLLVEAKELMAIMTRSESAREPDGSTGPVVVDVRPIADYEAGHIPGALQLDPNAVVARFSPVDGSLRSIADLESLLSGLGISAARRVVFYDDRGGFHAARMLWLLEYLGHSNVTILNGGWSAWKAAGGPASNAATIAEPALFQAALSPRRHASAADVLAHRGEARRVLIDVRPEKLFAKGHVPWAINVPWSQNLGSDGRFLGAAALRAHFAEHGVSPESNVIMHCQIGLASAHSYVALRLLGFPQVRVYHRSWAEWGKDPSLPKATS